MQRLLKTQSNNISFDPTLFVSQTEVKVNSGMRVQEFLDFYIQLTFKLQQNFLQLEQEGIFPPVLLFSGQNPGRLIQNSLMEKSNLNLGILAFLYSMSKNLKLIKYILI